MKVVKREEKLLKGLYFIKASFHLTTCKAHVFVNFKMEDLNQKSFLS